MYINRDKLKYRGRFRFRANYWHAVLVAFVYFLLNGGATVASRSYNTTTTTTNRSFSYNASYSLADDPSLQWIAGLAIGVILIAIAVGFAFAIFVVNPINVGIQTFFLRNSSGEAEGFHLGDGFKYNYLNVVKTMFFMNLWILLWTLLFIIPGIIKSYSYRLVPYILAENPDIDTNEALMRSEQLMRGNKWETFIYDLSFIGWYILSIFTCGILSIFWVQPYKLACDAELYRLLAGKSGEDYSFGVEGTGTGPSGYEEPSYHAPGFDRNDSASTANQQPQSGTVSTSSNSGEEQSDNVIAEEDTIEYKPGE
nr:DUF975 family protein [uncultured Mogibacterium sp.]